MRSRGGVCIAAATVCVCLGELALAQAQKLPPYPPALRHAASPKHALVLVYAEGGPVVAMRRAQLRQVGSGLLRNKLAKRTSLPPGRCLEEEAAVPQSYS